MFKLLHFLVLVFHIFVAIKTFIFLLHIIIVIVVVTYMNDIIIIPIINKVTKMICMLILINKYIKLCMSPCSDTFQCSCLINLCTTYHVYCFPCITEALNFDLLCLKLSFLLQWQANTTWDMLIASYCLCIFMWHYYSHPFWDSEIWIWCLHQGKNTPSAKRVICITEMGYLCHFTVSNAKKTNFGLLKHSDNLFWFVIVYFGMQWNFLSQ